MAEKKQELEKRLQDVTGQLGNPATARKTPKKGMWTDPYLSAILCRVDLLVSSPPHESLDTAFHHLENT